MSAHWEYMIVSWQYKTNYATKGVDEETTWESLYRITRPGSETETVAAGDLTWITFLNDLGADGWEMVTESLRKSIIFSQTNGWHNVASPVEIVWNFKRLAT